MLIPQRTSGECSARQGSCAEVLAELQANQVAPQIPRGIYRQRLLGLAERLARVQALKGEYARVDFSPHVAERLQRLGQEA